MCLQCLLPQQLLRKDTVWRGVKEMLVDQRISRDDKVVALAERLAMLSAENTELRAAMGRRKQVRCVCWGVLCNDVMSTCLRTQLYGTVGRLQLWLRLEVQHMIILLS